MSGRKSLATPGSVGRARRLSQVLILSAGLAIAGHAVAAGSGQASQKSRLDAFVTYSGLPRGWVASIKPDIVVAIRDRDALGDRNPADKVRLQGEVIDDDAADRLGYRSMRSVVEVNCETRRDRVVEMEVFSDHGLKGTSQGRTLPGGWVQPSEDAYMADVIRVVCRATPKRSGAVLARRDAPEPPTVEPARKPPPAPASKPPVSKPPVPAPQAPPVLAKAEPPPVRPPAAAPPRTPSPDGPIATAVIHTPREPAPAIAPATPASETPATVAQAAPPPVKPEPKARPAPPKLQVKPPTASGGPVTAQVGALDSEADARRALKALSSLMAGAMTPQIQPAKVGERTFYRAVVAGFATRAEANAFCAAVTRKGGDCLVR